MRFIAGSSEGHAPLGYIVLSLGFAGLIGWGVSESAAQGTTVQSLLIASAAAGVALAVTASLRAARRADRLRLAQFEERLRESEERLRQAQKMEAIGQLAGGIAHDFNNLVTVIGCSVGLITDATTPDDPRQDDLGQIKEAADRAAALTRQLLAFSRRQMLQPKPLDLNNVVRDLEKMIRRVIGTNITVHTTLDRKLGQVLADIGQIEQIIMNLAVNARDAMPSGGALMFATANRSVRMPEPHRHGVIEPGEYVTLTVRDTGQGMTGAILEHLFEPFFTTKEQGKGTGLGLATVHGIVYQSGGHIMVESAPGMGTTFTLLFPRIGNTDRTLTPGVNMRSTGEHRAESGNDRTHEGMREGAREDTSQRLSERVSARMAEYLRESAARTPRILIVDDEDAIRDVGARVLRQAGYHVYTAKHGEEAVAILERERALGTPISLIVTDVVMPVMGGRELTDWVRKEYPETRVLCMSGYARDELFRQYLIDDAIKLVHKPFEVTELTAAVREVLQAPATA